MLMMGFTRRVLTLTFVLVDLDTYGICFKVHLFDYLYNMWKSNIAIPHAEIGASFISQ